MGTEPVTSSPSRCGSCRIRTLHPSFGDHLGLRVAGAPADGSGRRGTGLIRELAELGSFARFAGEPAVVHRPSWFLLNLSGGPVGQATQSSAFHPWGEAGPPVVPASTLPPRLPGQGDLPACRSHSVDSY